jgi:hypothetical protein
MADKYKKATPHAWFINVAFRAMSIQQIGNIFTFKLPE